MPKPALPTVGVVFVNHHSEDKIQARVPPLVRANFAVVVVDNSGTWPDVRGDRVVVVRPRRNLGFGEGCNVGEQALPASVTALVLHNPDVSTDPASIEELVSTLASRGRPAVVAPAVRTGSTVRTRGLRQPSLAREAVASARHVCRRRVSMSDGSDPRGAGSIWRFVADRGPRFATGALLVLDRPRFVEIGGFDARYFLYVEDADLCRRMCDRQRPLTFRSDVVADHEARTGGQLPLDHREILRMIGVQLYTSLHVGRRWRILRLLHRVALRAGGTGGGSIGAIVGDAWRRGQAPEEVAERVSAHLRSPDGAGRSADTHAERCVDTT